MSPSKSFKAALLAAVFAFGAVAGSPAWADRGYGHGHGHAHYRHGGNHYWGLGLGLLAGTAIILSAQPRPVYYPPYVYAPPPVVVVPGPPVMAAPPPQTVPSDAAWWYFCSNPAGYYPYVVACPSGWTRVPPTPN